jgi:hypothetical protein
MFSTAMAEKVAAKGTPRRLAIAALVGSLTTMPSGTTLPAASPMRYALKASRKPRRCGSSKQNLHACARTAKRRPASRMMTAKPQPIFEMFDQISSGPARQTKYANSASPASAKAAPAGARLLEAPPSFTFSPIDSRSVYGRRAARRLPLPCEPLQDTPQTSRPQIARLGAC